MYRIAKIAAKMSRIRVSSVLKFASLLLAEIREKHFEELTNSFIAGIKGAVEENQLVDAKKQLKLGLAKDTQKKNLDQSIVDEFKDLVESKNIYLINKDHYHIQKKFLNEGISRSTIVKADNYVSWKKLISGQYDRVLKSKIKEALSKYSNEDIFTDYDLLEEVFDKITMNFAKYGTSLKKLTNARMFLKSFDQFLSFPAINKFKREEKVKERKEGIVPEKDSYLENPMQAIEDKKIKQDFINFLQKRISQNKNKSKLSEMDSAAVFLIDKVIEAGGFDKFNYSKFYDEFKKPLKKMGLTAKHQVRLLAKEIKDYALSFIEQEIPGMGKSMATI